MWEWYFMNGKKYLDAGYLLCAINNAWKVDPANLRLWFRSADYFVVAKNIPDDEVRSKWIENAFVMTEPFFYKKKEAGTMLLNVVCHLLNNAHYNGVKIEIAIAGSDLVYYNDWRDHFYEGGTPDPMRLGREYLVEQLNLIKKHAEKIDCKIYNVGGQEETLYNIDELVIIGTGFSLEGISFPDVESIKVFESQNGLSDVVNEAVEKHITGDYFSILPDDDFYTAGIRQIVEHVKEGGFDIFYFPSKHLIEDEVVGGLFDNSPGVTFEQNVEQNRITGSAFIKKDAFLFLGGYKGDICMDWDLYNRALKSGMAFEYLDIPGVFFRFNNHSRLQKKANEIGFASIKEKIRWSAETWNKKPFARCAAGMGLC